MQVALSLVFDKCLGVDLKSSSVHYSTVLYTVHTVYSTVRHQKGFQSKLSVKAWTCGGVARAPTPPKTEENEEKISKISKASNTELCQILFEIWREKPRQSYSNFKKLLPILCLAGLLAGLYYEPLCD